MSPARGSSPTLLDDLHLTLVLARSSDNPRFHSLFSHGTAPRNYRIPMIIGMGPQVLSLALTFVLPET